MHGLIFRTIQAFVSDSFGPDVWAAAMQSADCDVPSFEAMLDYEAALLPTVISGCARVLDRPQDTILEDIGTYLVTQQNHASIRRLMRFGGHSFTELLHTLDELPGRTRLAVAGLELPDIMVREHRPNSFTVQCSAGPRGFGHVLVGLLRAMADDYGALAILDHLGTQNGTEVIDITVVDGAFAKDRGFSLSVDAVEAAS